MMHRLTMSARRAGLAFLAAASCAVLTAGVAAPGTAQASVPPVRASGYGTIGNYHSGKCLDDPGFSSGSTQYDIWGCNYGTNQEFKELYYKQISYDGSEIPLYVIQNESSHKCLDLWGGSSTWGTAIKQYTCNSSDDAQWWYLYPTDIPGWYLLASQATGYETCITVTDDSQSDGAKVESWGCTSSAGGDHAMYWEPHSFG
jgi:pectate lyase